MRTVQKMRVFGLLAVLCWGAWCLLGTKGPDVTSERGSEEAGAESSPGLRGQRSPAPVARATLEDRTPAEPDAPILSARDLIATLETADAAFEEAGSEFTIDLSGHVLNPDGTPCDGATVQLDQHVAPQWKSLTSTTTAPDGSWRITTTVSKLLKPKDDFWLRLSAGQNGVVTSTRLVASLGRFPNRVIREERIQLSLRARVQVRVHVVDEVGVDIVGASCVFGQPSQQSTLPPVFTDGSGRARVRMLSRSRGEDNGGLHVTHPGFAYGHVYVKDPQPEKHVVLKRASALRGTLVNEVGEPLPDLAFHVDRDVDHQLNPVFQEATSDALGRFELTDYAALGDRFTLSADGYVPLVVEVPKDTSALTWRLERAPRPYRWLLLKERQSGRWLNIVKCHAQWSDQYEVPVECNGSDIPDPRIPIAGLTPNTWELSIDVAGYPDSVERLLTLTSETPEVVVWTVDRPTGFEIRGTLTDRSGTPLVGIPGWVGYAAVSTDARGRFVAYGLGRREYPVRFAPENLAAVETMVRVADGETTKQVDLVAGPGATIVVRRPPSVGRAGCLPASGSQRHAEQVTTLHRVPAGEVAVGLIGSGMSDVTQWTETVTKLHVTHEQHIEVDLRRTSLGRVFGRVVGSDGRPRRSVWVGLGAIPTWESSVYKDSRTTDHEGRFAFESVVPGRYVVSGVDDEFKVEVTVTAGASKELHLVTGK